MTKSIPRPMSSAAVPLVADDSEPTVTAEKPNVQTRPQARGSVA